MKNSAFIKLDSELNYIDVYTEYGVSFVKGAYLQLLKRPASKGYVTNDSRLANGVGIVAKPKYAKYQSKTVSVMILLEGNSRAQFVNRLEAFMAKISQGLFCLKIPSYHRVFRLVYTDIKIKQEFRNYKATFTLEMMEPNVDNRETI